MLIFTGYGIFTFFIGCAVLVGFSQFSKGELVIPYIQNVQAAAIFCCLGAVLNYAIGKHMNSKPGRKLLDLETKEIFELKDTHTFFWVPMQYWSFVFILLAAFFAYAGIK